MTRTTAGAERTSPARLHLHPMSVVLVMAGGVLGAAGREAIDQALPTPSRGFPVATFLINVAGAFVLGLLLEALVRSGGDRGWRRNARLAAGTGFCGAFTTYSTLAVESVQLDRHGEWAIGAGYVVASVIAGLVAAASGIALGAAHARWTVASLPVDPDLDTDDSTDAALDAPPNVASNVDGVRRRP